MTYIASVKNLGSGHFPKLLYTSHQGPLSSLLAYPPSCSFSAGQPCSPMVQRCASAHSGEQALSQDCPSHRGHCQWLGLPQQPGWPALLCQAWYNSPNAASATPAKQRRGWLGSTFSDAAANLTKLFLTSIVQAPWEDGLKSPQGYVLHRWPV